MLEKLLEIERRFEQLEAEYHNPEIVSNPKEMQRVGKQRAELEPIVGVIREYKKVNDDLQQAREMLSDPEMKEMAQAEIEPAKARIVELEEKLKMLLLPKDPNDDRSVIIEIRSAAGGDESALFAAELYRMYTRYAERKKWKYELIDYEEIGIGGMSSVTFKIDALGAYSQLKHESGVHCVKRVPTTEAQGRLHTSTITVAVLPEADDVEVDIKDDDLEFSTFRSSSAGGQHMQKNETAVRVIHRPTGLVATCQDERSQQQNRLKALAVLKAKLFQMELEKAAAERAGMRKGQIGSGDRSEKIRTYHFQDGRITDHRIKMTVHNVSAFLDGDIQEMIDALVQDEQARKLAETEAA